MWFGKGPKYLIIWELLIKTLILLIPNIKTVYIIIGTQDPFGFEVLYKHNMNHHPRPAPPRFYEYS